MFNAQNGITSLEKYLKIEVKSSKVNERNKKMQLVI